MPFKRLTLATTISDRLHVMANQLKTRSRASFTDANHSLEFVMARFFNALFGWSLVNLNTEQANFPAADLGDRVLRIAIQVTIECSSDKIKTTAEKAVEHQLGTEFDQLIIFFLLPKKPGMPRNFEQPINGPQIECWDLADLLKEMKDINDLGALTEAFKILDEEIGSSGSRHARAPLHQLPPRPEGFVGREEDLKILRALNPASGAVLTGLRGMGGIRKSALALVLAHEWAPSFPDAQLFLNARGTQPNPHSATDLMAQVIQAFHPTEKLPDDEAQLKSSYHDVLHGRRVLILMDNVSDAAQAAPLIPPDGCAFIVTSRRGFTLGTTAAHFVGKLPDVEAIALLRSFHPDINSTDASELARLCAGLPLALRIAGAQIAMDASERSGKPNVSAYLSALRNGRLGTLDANAPDAGEVTISETIRLSEAQLTPGERDAWRKLGVFSVSFDESAASSIAGTDVSILKNLVRRSLLEREGEDRYKMHELAADYVCSQFSELSLATLRLRHATYYTDVCRFADSRHLEGDTVGGLALFDAERSQIEAAFAWLASRTDPPSARLLIRLVHGSAYSSDLRLHSKHRIAWLECQLSAARHVDDLEMEGTALGNLGNAYADLGDVKKAQEFYDSTLVITRKNGDRHSEGNALCNLGIKYAARQEMSRALTCFKQALEIARDIGDRRGECKALGNLGIAHDTLGNTPMAIKYHIDALTVASDVGDRRSEGSILGNLGIAYRRLGNESKAIELYKQQIQITHEIGDQRGESSALGNLGLACSAMGNSFDAINYFERQLIISREIGDPRGEGNALFNSAHEYFNQGHRL